MRRTPLLWSAIVLVALITFGLAGAWGSRGGDAVVGSHSDGLRDGRTDGGKRTGAGDTELVISAASSLQDVFRRLATEFERQHPGVQVSLNVAGSQRLRAQIEQGAPVDVFASANRRYVDALERDGLAAPGRLLARNGLVAVVPIGNPASIRAFEDLPRAERIVLAAPDVPAGEYADRIVERAAALYGPSFADGVRAQVVSRELNVRQVFAKVALGEADAGLVYATDARGASDRVRTIAIPDELNVKAEYVMTVVEGTANPSLAREWVSFAFSPTGRRLLAEFGFTPTSGEEAGS